MAFSAILRRSANNAASRLIGTQKNFQSSAAVKRAALSPQFLRSAACYTTRHFSTSVATNSSPSNSKLLHVLQSKIEESQKQIKTEGLSEDFPFEIEYNVGKQTVTLTRQYEGETISVKVSMLGFECDEETDEDENENEYYDDEDKKYVTSTIFGFPGLATVIKKNGSSLEFDCKDRKYVTSRRFGFPVLATVIKKNGSSLEFDCIAHENEIKIISLSLKNPETEDQLAYKNIPDFLDLDYDLQRAFQIYLEIRGVDSNTTNNLRNYMLEKDRIFINKYYLRWLKDVKKIVEA